jgi:hypothetical protein
MNANILLKAIDDLAAEARDLTNRQVNGDVDLTPAEMEHLDSLLLDILNFTRYPSSDYSKRRLVELQRDWE